MKNVLIALLCCTILSSAISPSYAGKQNIKFDVDVQEDLNYRQLFNQKETLKEYHDVLEEEGLSHLVEYDNITEDSYTTPLRINIIPRSTETLNKALQDDFLKRKTRAMKENLAIACAPGFLQLGWVSMIAGCLPVNCVGEFGRSMQATKALSGVYEATTEGTSAVRMILDPERDLLLQYELQYAAVKRFLPASLQDSIENLFSSARQNNKAFASSLERLPKVLNLPICSKEPNPNVSRDLQRLTSGYLVEGGKSLSEALLNTCAGHYANYMHKVGPDMDHFRQIIYLRGEPGVGKTYMAQYVAEAMGVNFHKISLSRGAKEFFGTDKTPGTFLETLLSGRAYLNDVFLLDEADHTLNNSKEDMTSWLQFLDPETKEVFFPFLNAKLDVSHFFFILAMNSKVQNKAMDDRNTTDILITGLEPEFKLSILKDSILPKLLRSENPIMNLGIKDLGVSDEAFKKIIADDKNPGFRTLKRIFNEKINTIRAERLKDAGAVTSQKSISVGQDAQPLHFMTIDQAIGQVTRKDKTS